MILSPREGKLSVVTQRDHAHFAAELLSMWRVPELLAHPRRRQLLEAIREHDNGWQESDAAPRVNPATGAPYSFIDLPVAERLEIWRRGAHRFAVQEPYVALLVTEHARALFAGREGEEPYDELLAELDELRQALLEGAGLGLEEAAADYRWLELADALSLTACDACLPAPELHGWRGELRAKALLLEPFPLAGATTFEVACRWIPERRYDGDADLGGELAAARWQRLRIQAIPYPQAAT